MASASSTPAKRLTKRDGGKPASGGGDEGGATEYERQRLSRIRENQERLEALGLRSLASALLGSSTSGHDAQADDAKKRRRQKKKGRGGEEDDEYRPSGEEMGDGSPSSREEETEEDGEGHGSPPGARQRPRGKGQKKNSSNAVKVGKRLLIQSKMDELDDMDDDVALRQAIAASLEEPMKCSGGEANMVCQVSTRDTTSVAPHVKSDVAQGTPGGGKRRKANVKRPQMTEDELVAYFFSFDEAGKGGITPHDLTRMAITHDFCWTNKEIADMIYLFDSNRDGQLSLDEFRAIVSRCNMMRDSGNG